MVVIKKAKSIERTGEFTNPAVSAERTKPTRPNTAPIKKYFLSSESRQSFKHFNALMNGKNIITKNAAKPRNPLSK